MDKRGTGRTTSMLREAIQAAREGNYVMVMAQSTLEAKRLQTRAGLMVDSIPFATKIKVGDGEITFESVSDSNWDWRMFRPRGAYPTIPVFVDHWAIESTFDLMLRELHRYDS